MSAGSKVSCRIFALVLVVLGFAASCGQLLGDVEVAGDAPTRGTGNLCPSVVTADTATPLCPPTREVICEDGSTRCDDRLLQLCTDGGRAWVTWQQCASAALCEASDLSTVAACITPKCSVEQMSCEGNVLRLCTEDRTGWQVFDTCKTAAHCDAGQRQCLPAPCEPGDRRCNVGNLERCRDDQMDWEALDKCATNEVCEATLVGVLPGATQGGVEGQAPLPLEPAAAPGSVAEPPITCLAAKCLNREVKCNGAQLLACNEGQTDFFPAEPCATPVLCEASIAYTGIRGSPRCVRPTCDEGQHRCSETGVLEVCNADRTGYLALEECIGPPFCNAVAADNGGPGCEDAPCQSGEERCNGPQIQICSADRTRFDPGETCETRDLCNDDNSSNAFCRAPVCQRGPLSGTEFRCQGAVLQRCNDQHTGYDTLNTCATAGLCNAGLAFNGCVAPTCAPGQTRCQGDFVQVCNAQRNGFDNLERCAQGTCDGNAGRCADPCIEGSARCNGQGQLEECRNRLDGRVVTARCLSANLCDANARTCRQPPPGCTADGVRVCTPQGGGVTALQVCTAGRSAFSTLDLCTGGEICDPNNAPPNTNLCDACSQNSQPTCQGNDLVSCSADGITPGRVTCPNGCQTVENGPDRCRNCVLGSATCDGAGLLVCVASGPTNEFRERRPCTTAGACTATLAACNAGRNGENCSCRPGVCAPGERDCNGNQPTVCADDLLSRVSSGPSCGTKVCFPKPDPRAGTCGCTPGVDVQCVAGLLQICNRLGVFENEPRFTPGGILCVPSSGGSGESAVSCDGNRVVGPEACAIDCNEASGCAECDPETFPSVCDGPATHAECRDGQIEERLSCGSTNNSCREVVCAGAGECNPSSPRPDGTVCPGGICEGGTCAICGDGLVNGREQCDTRGAGKLADCPPGQHGQINCTADCRRQDACEDDCDPVDCGSVGCASVESCNQCSSALCASLLGLGNCQQASCGGPGGLTCQATPTACPTGQSCNPQNGQCERACDPSAVGQCTGASFVKCNSQGTGFDTTICASAALCSASGCAAPCVDSQCGSVGCNNERTACNSCSAELCASILSPGNCQQASCGGAGGLTCQLSATTCAKGQSCNPQNGRCETAQVCDPNAPGECNGVNFSKCNALGTGFDRTMCASPALCSASGCAAACVDSQCGSVGCNPNGTGCNTCSSALCATILGVGNCQQASCGGPGGLMCQLNPTVCPVTGQNCNPQNGQCEATRVCAPNALTCQGNNVRQCSADGTLESTVGTCGGDGSDCVTPSSCVPGQTQCRPGDVQVGAACNANTGTCNAQGGCDANQGGGEQVGGEQGGG